LSAAWSKANEYYAKLDLSPAYYTATILHPYLRTYCNTAWADKPDWLDNNNRRFRALWAEYNTAPHAIRCPNVFLSNMNDAIDSLINPRASATNNLAEDEYNRWKRSESRVEKGSQHANNPIKYWVALRNYYPSLSKLALDVLSIPASSCECEHMFGELGDLLEPCRRAIQPQLLAAIQCVRRWRRAGLGDDQVATKVP
jgi:hypothetical protein